MAKKQYITKKELKKCQQVADAYAKELEEGDIVLLNAGRFGFVMLQYFQPPIGFDSAKIFTNSAVMFEFLWNEWLNIQLIKICEEMCLTEIEYEEIFELLAKKQQKELMDRKRDFAIKARIHFASSSL